MHEVLKLIGERVRTGSKPGQRADEHRIAASIEGGGMRGTVSAGMALALHELGLVCLRRGIRLVGGRDHRGLAGQFGT